MPRSCHERVCAACGGEVYPIAGVDVGAAVQLRWRGCMQTLLDEPRAVNGKGARVLKANQDSDGVDIDLNTAV